MSEGLSAEYMTPSVRDELLNENVDCKVYCTRKLNISESVDLDFRGANVRLV